MKHEVTPSKSALRLTSSGSVLRVLIDHPPLNLLDAELMLQLDDLASRLESDEQIDVVVFDSADPDFFIAHGDMSIIDDSERFAALPVAVDQRSDWNPMMRLHERLRTLPQVTIGVLRGLARGGGSELFSALDLRYGSLEHAGLAQMETPTGIIPGAGATAYLTRHLGLSRALETILTARLVDAATAERWGWLTRALPDADLNEYLEGVIASVSSLPSGVARAAKLATNAADPVADQALSVANTELGKLFDDDAVQLTRVALESGAQTREGERHLETVLDRVRAVANPPGAAPRARPCVQ